MIESIWHVTRYPMSSRPNTSTGFKAAIIVIVAVGAGCSSPEDERAASLLALAPGLPSELARHVVSDDDDALSEYARGVGAPVFSGYYTYLFTRLDTTSVEAFASTGAVVFPAMKRIRAVVQVVFRGDEPHLSGLFDLTPEDGLRAMRLYHERATLVQDSDVPYDRVMERLKAMADTFDEFGMAGQAAVTLTLMSEVAGRNADVEAFIELSHVALDAANAAREWALTCQLMGTLGSHYGTTGHLDSMRVYWDGALDLSRRKHLPNHEARITMFYARHFEQLGRLGLAQDYYTSLMDIVRDGNTGRMGLRFLVSALEFHADLDAWEIVGRNLPRAKRMEHAPGYVGAPYEELHRVELRVVEARYLIATGRVERADSVFANCRDRLRGTFYAEHYIRVLRYWAEGLLESGRPSDAVPIVEEGLAFTADVNQVGDHCVFLILRARAAVEARDLATAERILDEFESATRRREEELSYEWIASAVLRARIEGQRQNPQGVLVHLNTAVDRFVRSARSVDPSVHGYLWIGRCDELRTQLHLALKDEPDLGYGVELFWRDAFSLLGKEATNHAPPTPDVLAGAGPVSSRPGGPLVRRMARYADAAIQVISGYGAVHCTYLPVGGEVWRWTCTRGEVRRDVLDAPAAAVADVARRAWTRMSTDPGEGRAGGDGALDAELEGELRELGAVLLPPEVTPPAGGSRPSLFLVTAEGFLGRIPFEALDPGGGGRYRPLLESVDVGYVRHLRPPAPVTSDSPGLVVANSISGRPGRDFCTSPLSAAAGEAQRVAGRHPGSEVLLNESATKAKVLASWQNASFLYLATHLLEDPDVPYLSLVPLAPTGASDAPATTCLDMADVRAADFSRCRAVVLNQCSSGRPYIGARNTSPGLASAFLDAGAGAVIQTLWNVRDVEAGSFMPAIAGDLDSPVMELVRSLARAKRARMAGPSGARHPFLWAPYTILLGRL